MSASALRDRDELPRARGQARAGRGEDVRGEAARAPGAAALRAALRARGAVQHLLPRRGAALRSVLFSSAPGTDQIGPVPEAGPLVFREMRGQAGKYSP